MWMHSSYTTNLTTLECTPIRCLPFTGQRLGDRIRVANVGKAFAAF